MTAKERYLDERRLAVVRTRCAQISASCAILGLMATVVILLKVFGKI